MKNNIDKRNQYKESYELKSELNKIMVTFSSMDEIKSYFLNLSCVIPSTKVIEILRI